MFPASPNQERLRTASAARPTRDHAGGPASARAGARGTEPIGRGPCRSGWFVAPRTGRQVTGLFTPDRIRSRKPRAVTAPHRCQKLRSIHPRLAGDWSAPPHVSPRPGSRDPSKRGEALFRPRHDHGSGFLSGTAFSGPREPIIDAARWLCSHPNRGCRSAAGLAQLPEGPALILMSTPAGKLSLFSASIVLLVG